MTEYTYGAAYVGCLEKNMLSGGDFESLTRADVREIITVLTEHGYEGRDFREMLEKERIKTAEICRELCGDEPCMRALLSEKSFHNIKTLLRARIFEGNCEKMLYDPPEAESFDENEKKQSSDDELFEIYRTAEEIYRNTSSIRHAEMYVNREQVLRRMRLCSKNKFMYRLAEICSLNEDLKIYLSSDFGEFSAAMTENSFIDVNYMIHSKKSKEETLAAMGYEHDYILFERSAAEFEKYCDNRIGEYASVKFGGFFGVESVCAFFLGKETEIKNLRILMYAKSAGADAEFLENRLRKAYV